MRESKTTAREKAKQVVVSLREMKLFEAVKKVEDSIEEALTYMGSLYEHWLRIRRRTCVVGTFSDGNSALMFVSVRLQHAAGTHWGNRKYMNMNHLDTLSLEDTVAS